MLRNNAVDRLLEEILVDAYGEDEQLWAFRQAFVDEMPLPGEGTVIGEAVSVTRIDYDGNPQRGLRATCNTGFLLFSTLSPPPRRYPPESCLQVFNSWAS